MKKLATGFPNLLLSTALLALAPFCMGQVADNDSTATTQNYDVQRVYDKDGNLIYYDSTIVREYNMSAENAEFDSLLTVWKEEDRNVSYSVQFPKDSFSYSFELPDDFFDFAPEYRFDMEVPDFDSLLRGFDYYFSLSPVDSARRSPRDKPYFEFHGKVPEIDPDLNSRLWEMERRMLEFQDRILNEYDEWDERQREERKRERLQTPPPPAPADTTRKAPAAMDI